MTRGLRVIVLPGGGYEMYGVGESEPVEDWLRDLGFDAHVFRYPLLTRHPGPLRAVRAEVARVRAAGAERVALLGFSAGGHAAAHAALAPGAGPGEVPDLVALAYPVVSMQHPKVTRSRTNLIGLDADDELRAATSADLLVTPGAPPFFIWHTAVDEVAVVEHSYRLVRALAENGVPHELHVFPEGPHGLNLARGVPGAERWPELLLDWLARQIP